MGGLCIVCHWLRDYDQIRPLRSSGGGLLAVSWIRSAILPAVSGLYKEKTQCIGHSQAGNGFVGLMSILTSQIVILSYPYVHRAFT